MTDLDEMWAALEAHQPIADARGYGLEWREMCEQRTPEAARAAWVLVAVDMAVAAACGEEAERFHGIRKEDK